MPIGPAELLVGMELAGFGAITCTEVEPWEVQVEAREQAPAEALTGHTWRVACATCKLSVRVDPVTLIGPGKGRAGAVLAWSGPQDHLRLELDNEGRARLVDVRGGISADLWSATVDTSDVPKPNPVANLVVANTTLLDPIRIQRAWTLEARRAPDALEVRIRDGKRELARADVHPAMLERYTPVPGTKMHRVGIESTGTGGSSMLTAALNGVAIPVPAVEVELDSPDLVGALGGALSGKGLPLPSATGAWKGAGCKLPDLPERDGDEDEDQDKDDDSEQPDPNAPSGPGLALGVPTGAPGVGGPSAPGAGGPAAGGAAGGGPGGGAAAGSGGAGGAGGAGGEGTTGGEANANQPSPNGSSDAVAAGGEPPGGGAEAVADASVEPQPARSNASTSSGDRLSRPLVVGGAAAVLGAGVSYAIALSQRGRFNSLDTPYEDLDGIRGTVNRSSAVGTGLLVAGAGLGVSAVVVGKW